MLLYKQLDSGFVDYLVRGIEPHIPPKESSRNGCSLFITFLFTCY